MSSLDKTYHVIRTSITPSGDATYSTIGAFDTIAPILRQQIKKLSRNNDIHRITILDVATQSPVERYQNGKRLTH